MDRRLLSIGYQSVSLLPTKPDESKNIEIVLQPVAKFNDLWFSQDRERRREAGLSVDST
tara:strand:+ start:15478 stop:15654 length:177 start_codon:yes stop_codon:yes gene_type:complete